jgi:hypothetical protein
VPRSCRLGRRRARLHAFECAVPVGEDDRQLGAQETQPLAHGNPTLQQKGTDLIDDAGALADRRSRTQCSACRSSWSAVLVANFIVDRRGTIVLRQRWSRDLLLLAGAAMNVRVEPLADDDAVALPPVHFDGILGVDGSLRRVTLTGGPVAAHLYAIVCKAIFLYCSRSRLLGNRAIVDATR